MTEPMFGALLGILFGAIFAVFFIAKGVRGLRSGTITVMNLNINMRTMSGQDRHVQLTGQDAKRRALFSVVLGGVVAALTLGYSVWLLLASP